MSIIWSFCSYVFFYKTVELQPSSKHLHKYLHFIHLLILVPIFFKNKQSNSLINFVGMSVDWTGFLTPKFLISSTVFSCVIVWKQNTESKFSMIMMLGSFSYLWIPSSIKFWQMYVVLRKSCSVFISKSGAIFTNKLLTILDSFSSYIRLSSHLI